MMLCGKLNISLTTRVMSGMLQFLFNTGVSLYVLCILPVADF